MVRRNELRLYVDAGQDTPISVVLCRDAIYCVSTMV